MELAFRMRERHLLRADCFKLSCHGENTLTRQLNFRNQVFRRQRPGRDQPRLADDRLQLHLCRAAPAEPRARPRRGLHLLSADALGDPRAQHPRDRQRHSRAADARRGRHGRSTAAGRWAASALPSVSTMASTALSPDPAPRPAVPPKRNVAIRAPAIRRSTSTPKFPTPTCRASWRSTRRGRSCSSA